MQKEGYKRVKIYVEEKVWDEFMKFIREHRGKVKGEVWPVLKEAIIEYMGGEPQSGFDPFPLKYDIKPTKTVRIVNAIGESVIDMFQEGKSVNMAWIRNWLKKHITLEEKTINKYLNYFREVYLWDVYPEGYIKPWTFRKVDEEPRWKSEAEYLNYLADKGKIEPTKLSKEKVKDEEEEIEELFNAEMERPHYSILSHFSSLVKGINPSLIKIALGFSFFKSSNIFKPFVFSVAITFAI